MQKKLSSAEVCRSLAFPVLVGVLDFLCSQLHGVSEKEKVCALCAADHLKMVGFDKVNEDVPYMLEAFVNTLKEYM